MASTTTQQQSNPSSDRPEFAVTLGLLPPYTMEDVKRAYLTKVKDAHPDRGGCRAAFERLEKAYQQAEEYIKFHSDPRQWIAARMEEYLAVMSLLERLDALGAEAETLTHDWVRQSFGDFADLTTSIVGIRARDVTHVAELIDTLVREQVLLAGLKQLDLADTEVTDELALELRVLRNLARLDLCRTAISKQALALVDYLPGLREFAVDGTSIGWWPRHKLRKTLHHRRLKLPDPVVHPTNIR